MTGVWCYYCNSHMTMVMALDFLQHHTTNSIRGFNSVSALGIFHLTKIIPHIKLHNQAFFRSAIPSAAASLLNLGYSSIHKDAFEPPMPNQLQPPPPEHLTEWSSPTENVNFTHT